MAYGVPWNVLNAKLKPDEAKQFYEWFQSNAPKGIVGQSIFYRSLFDNANVKQGHPAYPISQLAKSYYGGDTASQMADPKSLMNDAYFRSAFPFTAAPTFNANQFAYGYNPTGQNNQPNQQASYTPQQAVFQSQPASQNYPVVETQRNPLSSMRSTLQQPGAALQPQRGLDNNYRSDQQNENYRALRMPSSSRLNQRPLTRSAWAPNR